MKGKTIGIIVLALCLPGGIPVALGVWGYRAIVRFRARREIRTELVKRGASPNTKAAQA